LFYGLPATLPEQIQLGYDADEDDCDDTTMTAIMDDNDDDDDDNVLRF
jgi:hypothetical protein